MQAKKVKIIIIVSVMLIVAVVFGAFTKLYVNKNTSGLPMTIARYYWPGMYWIEIADKKGWFKDAGLDVRLVDANPDYFQSLEDSAAGKIDMNTYYLFDFIHFYSLTSDLVAIINSDISYGADGIVAKQDIKDISDLKGKKIGLKVDSQMDYVMETLLLRNGLITSDVTIVDMPAEETASAFINGEVDAIVAWEPFVSQAVEVGGGHTIFRSSQIPGIAPAVIAFKKEFIDQRREDVQAMVNVWHKTTEYIKNNPVEAYRIIAEIYRTSENEVAQFATIDKIMDLEANKAAFTASEGFESLYGVAKSISEFLIEHKINERNALDINVMFDASFIRNIRE